MTPTTPIPLRKRLLSVAELIPSVCDLVLDIGTDHAQLPVYLVQRGIASRVIASDIAPEPLKRAADTVSRYGCEEHVTLHLSDGLCGLETTCPDAIVIAGMGGEMIVHILERAPFVKEHRIPLILQPMTRSEVLRKWLGANGFTITEERLVADDKLYQILSCRYDGEKRELSPAQCVIGPRLMEGGDAFLPAHLDRLISVYETRLEGKKKGDCDAGEEEAILSALYDLKKEIKA